MSSLNKIILVGTVDSEPQQRVTNSGDAFATFTLIVERPERQDGAPAGQDAIDVVAWREVADRTQGLSAGQMVMVDGRVVTRTTESEDGRKQYFTEVDAKFIRNLSVSVSGGDASGLPVFDPNASGLETKESASLEESEFDFGGADKPLADESIEEEVPF